MKRRSRTNIKRRIIETVRRLGTPESEALTAREKAVILAREEARDETGDHNDDELPF